MRKSWPALGCSATGGGEWHLRVMHLYFRKLCIHKKETGGYTSTAKLCNLKKERSWNTCDCWFNTWLKYWQFPEQTRCWYAEENRLIQKDCTKNWGKKRERTKKKPQSLDADCTLSGLQQEASGCGLWQNIINEYNSVFIYWSVLQTCLNVEE